MFGIVAERICEMMVILLILWHILGEEKFIRP